MESTTTERIMTKEEAAAALGLAEVTIRKYLSSGYFPNAKKVPIAEGSRVMRWDIPNGDVEKMRRPWRRGGKPKPAEEIFARRNITLEPDVNDWLDKRQAGDPAFKVSEFINGLIRKVMSREDD